MSRFLLRLWLGTGVLISAVALGCTHSQTPSFIPEKTQMMGRMTTMSNTEAIAATGPALEQAPAANATATVAAPTAPDKKTTPGNSPAIVTTAASQPARPPAAPLTAPTVNGPVPLSVLLQKPAQ